MAGYRVKGTDGVWLEPIRQCLLICDNPEAEESVLLDVTAACRALDKLQAAIAARLLDVAADPVDDAGFSGWAVVPPPAELPGAPTMLLSADGRAAIRLDVAEDLARRSEQWPDDPEGR